MAGTIKLSSEKRILTIQEDRRREERVDTVIRGELTGMDRAGRLFMAEITIENVNEVGCRFECGIPLQAGDVVAISAPDPGPKFLSEARPHLFEVVWTNRRVAFWVIGASKLQDQTLPMIHSPALKFTPRCPPK